MLDMMKTSLDISGRIQVRHPRWLRAVNKEVIWSQQIYSDYSLHLKTQNFYIILLLCFFICVYFHVVLGSSVLIICGFALQPESEVSTTAEDYSSEVRGSFLFSLLIT